MAGAMPVTRPATCADIQADDRGVGTPELTSHVWIRRPAGWLSRLARAGRARRCRAGSIRRRPGPV